MFSFWCQIWTNGFQADELYENIMLNTHRVEQIY